MDSLNGAGEVEKYILLNEGNNRFWSYNLTLRNIFHQGERTNG